MSAVPHASGTLVAHEWRTLSLFFCTTCVRCCTLTTWKSKETPPRDLILGTTFDRNVLGGVKVEVEQHPCRCLIQMLMGMTRVRKQYRTDTVPDPGRLVSPCPSEFLHIPARVPRINSVYSTKCQRLSLFSGRTSPEN